jgi:hypothetical protein
MDMDATAINAAITEQSAIFNTLRLQKDADPNALEDAKKKLAELKKKLGELNKQAKAKPAGAASGSKEGEAAADAKKRERMLLKTAKVSCLPIFPVIYVATPQ